MCMRAMGEKTNREQTVNGNIATPTQSNTYYCGEIELGRVLKHLRRAVSGKSEQEKRERCFV